MIGGSLVSQEMLSGLVVISSKDSVQHQGVSLTMEGTVNLQLSSKSVGVFEAFYNSVKVRARAALSALRSAVGPVPVFTSQGFMVLTLAVLTEQTVCCFCVLPAGICVCTVLAGAWG